MTSYFVILLVLQYHHQREFHYIINFIIVIVNSLLPVTLHTHTHTHTRTRTHTHTHTHTRTHTRTLTHTHTHSCIHTIRNGITYYRSSTGGPTAQNINQARPSNPTEEDIQLQLALQMSKEHQEEVDKLRWALSRNIMTNEVLALAVVKIMLYTQETRRGDP